MTKMQFLQTLEEKLNGLPQEDVAKSLAFYKEMIEDGMEEGLAEEEAVAALGGVEEIARQILAEIPLTKLVGHKLKPKRALRGWEILLLVLGFPLWFSLIASAASVILSVIVTVWVIPILLCAADFALIAAGGVGVVLSPVQMATGSVGGGLLLLGCALAALGVSILLFFVAKAATKWLYRASKGLALFLKRTIIGR